MLDAIGPVLDPPFESTHQSGASPSWGGYRWPVLAGTLLLVVLFTIGAAQQGTRGIVVGALINKPAPDFTLTTYDGEPVRLSTLRGHPVVINFWASWCPPCRAEAASLNNVARSEQQVDRAVFVGINVRDDDESARRFLSDFSVSYANGPDPDNLEMTFQGIGIPYTVFIAADGTVARTWIGPLDEQRLTTIIDEIA
jgi:cytochrome c biogenesis protein CcmG/thiol:disulfide interchange protein DsbE